MEKKFRVAHAVPGRGNAIIIETDVEIPEGLLTELNKASIFGGDSSNHPKEYRFWELTASDVDLSYIISKLETYDFVREQSFFI